MNVKSKMKQKGRKRLVVGWVVVALAVLCAAVLLVAPPAGYVQRASGLGRLRLTLGGPWVTVLSGELPSSIANPPSGDGTPMADLVVTPARWSGRWSVAQAGQVAARNEEFLRVFVSFDPSCRVVRFSVWTVPGCIGVAGGALVLWGWLAVRRARRGGCAACGYDLRGLGDGAACPECGKKGGA